MLGTVGPTRNVLYGIKVSFGLRTGVAIENHHKTPILYIIKHKVQQRGSINLIQREK